MYGGKSSQVMVGIRLRPRMRMWTSLFSLLVLQCLSIDPAQGQQKSCTASSSGGSTTTNQDDDTGVCQSPTTTALRQCKMVVAPSTIPGAGLGIFTTVPIPAEKLIGYGDMVIPLPRIASTLPDPFEDYSWNGRVYSGSLNAFAPGLQSLMNSNLALLNCHQVKPATNVFYDSVDATPYHYLQTIAEHDIPAGGELFTFYGDHWFQGRDDRFRAIPLSDDFPLAENLTAAFSQLLGDNHHDHQQPWHADLWELIKDFPFSSRILRALPDYQDLSQVVQLGMRSLFQPQAMLDIEAVLYDETRSRCLDMIRQGPSSVHALGAFATRDIARGTIITGSPLLHTSKERWNEHGQVWDSFTKSYKKSNTGKASYALLINYCWGHVQSSLLLCPYGIGVGYINHVPEGRTPNVKIQWAPNGEISHNATSLDMAPKAIWTSVVHKVRLAIDYIALTDITEGDELLIDYGTAWWTAYQEHLSLEPKARFPASEWNSQTKDVLLLTEAEQSARPYPEHLEFKCHPNVMTPQLEFNVPDLWTASSSSTTVYYRDALDCQILERQENTQNPEYTTYIVRVFYQESWRGRAGIPRNYIRFFEKEGPVQKLAFRQEMQLPEEMVPDRWRDLK